MQRQRKRSHVFHALLLTVVLIAGLVVPAAATQDSSGGDASIGTEDCTLTVDLSGYQTIDEVLEYEWTRQVDTVETRHKYKLRGKPLFGGWQWVERGGEYVYSGWVTDGSQDGVTFGGWHVHPDPLGVFDDFVQGATYKWDLRETNNEYPTTTTETQWSVERPDGEGWEKTGNTETISAGDDMPNLVQVKVNDSMVASQEFGESWSGDFTDDLDDAGPNTFTVKVWDHNDDLVVDESEDIDCTPAPQCVSPAEADLTHTYDASADPRTGTVTLEGDLPLCNPAYVRATSYEFDDPSNDWPQTLVGYNDTRIQEPGTYDFEAPEFQCGQVDIYYGWDLESSYQGRAGDGELKLPDNLYGPNQPFEPRFLHEYSTGPSPTYHVDDAPCEVPTPDVDLNFQKIVCDDPANVRENPVSGTVTRVDELPEGCEFAAGWNFELLPYNATPSGETEFDYEVGPTSTDDDAKGTVSVAVADLLTEGDLEDFLGGKKLWVREIEQHGAEFGALQCHDDALNDDNLDFIELSTQDDPPADVWCVAWNLQLPPQTETLTVAKVWLDEDGEPAEAPSPDDVALTIAVELSDGSELELDSSEFTVETFGDYSYWEAESEVDAGVVIEDVDEMLVPEGYTEVACPSYEQPREPISNGLTQDGLYDLPRIDVVIPDAVVCNQQTPEVDIDLIKLWLDENGEPTDERPEGDWAVTATDDDDETNSIAASTEDDDTGITFSGWEDRLTVAADGSYTVAESDMEGWTEATCSEDDISYVVEAFGYDLAVDQLGTGSFSPLEGLARRWQGHLVCNQQEEPEPQPEPAFDATGTEVCTEDETIVFHVVLSDLTDLDEGSIVVTDASDGEELLSDTFDSDGTRTYDWPLRDGVLVDELVVTVSAEGADDVVIELDLDEVADECTDVEGVREEPEDDVERVSVEKKPETEVLAESRTLPKTGASVLGLFAAGLLALFVGAGTLMRRRRSES